jgi:hypothetical protein
MPNLLLASEACHWCAHRVLADVDRSADLHIVNVTQRKPACQRDGVTFSVFLPGRFAVVRFFGKVAMKTVTGFAVRNDLAVMRGSQISRMLLAL